MTKLEKARIRLCSERICAELSDMCNIEFSELKKALDDSSEMEILSWIFALASSYVGILKQLSKKSIFDFDLDEFDAYYNHCYEEFDDMLNGRVCKPEKIRKGVEGS